MARRPTIIDVAREAGVSKSTVSLVLQDSPTVAEATRKSVREAIARLGYVRNRSAAALRGSSAGLIGLVINDLRNPFYTEFATSAQMAFAARGYATVLANTDDDAKVQDQVIGTMIEHGVTALVIAPSFGDEGAVMERIERAGIPAMQVLRRAESGDWGREGRFPFASPDYAAGSHLAMEHLAGLGLERIAFAGGLEGRPITAERMAGYDAAVARGATPRLVLPGRPSRALGRALAHRLHREHPEIQAALCFSDLVALGMLAGFQELGVAVGREFRLMGFDDIEECALVWPQISSVACDIGGFGQRTAAVMLDWLESGIAPPAQHRSPVALRPRASTLGTG